MKVMNVKLQPVTVQSMLPGQMDYFQHAVKKKKLVQNSAWLIIVREVGQNKSVIRSI